MRTVIFLIIFFFLSGCRKEGIQGPQGEIGDAGIIGKDGSRFLGGVTNPTAALGSKGDFYLNLTSGDLFGPKTEIGWGNPYNMKGAKGEQGNPGSAILSGNSVPNLGIGELGDYYIDTKNVVLYGPKLASGWGDPVSLDKNENIGVSVYFIKADFSKGFGNYVSSVDSSFRGSSKSYSIPNSRNKVIELFWFSQSKNSSEPIVSQPWVPLYSDRTKNSPVNFGWNLSLFNVIFFASITEGVDVRFYIQGKGYTTIPDFNQPSENLYFIIKVSDTKIEQPLSATNSPLNRYRRINLDIGTSEASK